MEEVYKNKNGLKATIRAVGDSWELIFDDAPDESIQSDDLEKLIAVFEWVQVEDKS